MKYDRNYLSRLRNTHKCATEDCSREHALCLVRLLDRELTASRAKRQRSAPPKSIGESGSGCEDVLGGTHNLTSLPVSLL